MPETHAEDGVEVVATRQQPGAGPSRAAAAKGAAARRGQQQSGRRRAPHERQQQQQRQDVIDLTIDLGQSDDDDVQITQVKAAKRQRQRAAAGAGAGAGAAAALPTGLTPLALLGPQPAAAAAAAQQQPPAPPSPKGYKCIICLERMESDMATTTCGHMFCYKCISAWVQKSGNCPQCRGKLTKTKIIRTYPPPS